MAAKKSYDEYVDTAKVQMERFADAPLLHFINGQPTPSIGGETFENYSPIDGELLGSVASGQAADIDAAAQAADAR